MNPYDSPLVWRKSRRCDTGQCIEVAQLATGVALRDSAFPSGPMLIFSKRDWARFVAALRTER